MRRSKNYRALIAEAAEWRLIGLLLERPRGNWHEEVITLAREVVDDELRAATAAIATANEGAYLRLVGPGGAVSPREVAYQSFVDPGQLLAKLAVAYEAFAFRPRVEEPVDHIAVEVAFVGYLLLKEAFAAARGDDNDAATTEKARRSFVSAHLAGFVSPFTERLEHTGPSYLSAIARHLAKRVPAHPPTALGIAANDAHRDVCAACGVHDSQ
ncbi:MAG TPA: molecular chaperone TorD family protein [Candidatus Kryptonia bacterium]|nr:molecular chaperone TorD family protein [Candidatus Kryptonia bacterium]